MLFKILGTKIIYKYNNVSFINVIRSHVHWDLLLHNWRYVFWYFVMLPKKCSEHQILHKKIQIDSISYKNYILWTKFTHHLLKLYFILAIYMVHMGN